MPFLAGMKILISIINRLILVFENIASKMNRLATYNLFFNIDMSWHFYTIFFFEIQMFLKKLLFCECWKSIMIAIKFCFLQLSGCQFEHCIGISGSELRKRDSCSALFCVAHLKFARWSKNILLVVISFFVIIWQILDSS